MKLPDWLHEFFRKLPSNYTGQIVLDFDPSDERDPLRVERRDYFTKEIFHRRFGAAQTGDQADG